MEGVKPAEDCGPGGRKNTETVQQQNRNQSAQHHEPESADEPADPSPWVELSR